MSNGAESILERIAPSSSYTDRIAPWVNILIVSIGLVVAYCEYNGKEKESKIERSLDFVRQFYTGGNNLRSRLDSISEEMRKMHSLFQRPPEYYFQSKEHYNYEIRRRLRIKMLSVIKEKRLEDEIRSIYFFFRYAIECSKNKICDDGTLIGNLKSDMVGYLNATCPCLIEWRSSWRNKEINEIFLYLAEHNHQKYFCDEYRDELKKVTPTRSSRARGRRTMQDGPALAI